MVGRGEAVGEGGGGGRKMGERQERYVLKNRETTVLFRRQSIPLVRFC